MKRAIKSTLLIVALAFASTAEAKVKVVATITDLGAITREVGGDQVDVVTLTKPAQDPHFVDARPSLVLDLSRADLLVLVGLDLEVGWLPTLLTQSRNPNIQRGSPGYFDCSTAVELREVPQQKLDRTMGDIHAGGNPHYTKDPHNAIKVARAIAGKLAEADSEHAALYQANAERFSRELEAKISEWEKALAPYRGAPMVSYHKSWTYLDGWAGFDEVAYVEPKPGLAPSISHLAKVMQVIMAKKAKVILIEPWYPSATSETLAEKTGAKVVKLPGMAGEKERYQDHLATVVKLVVEAMSKK